jgi:hypothetical protein
MEKYMRENDIEMIVSGLNHSLISFTACAGKMGPFPPCVCLGKR